MRGSWNSVQNQAECLSDGAEGRRQPEETWKDTLAVGSISNVSLKGRPGLKPCSMAFWLVSFCKAYILSNSGTKQALTKWIFSCFPISCRASPTFISLGQFFTFCHLVAVFVLYSLQVTSEDHVIFPISVRDNLSSLFLPCSPTTNPDVQL